jgi:hypothetical protein
VGGESDVRRWRKIWERLSFGSKPGAVNLPTTIVTAGFPARAQFQETRFRIVRACELGAYLLMEPRGE